MSTQVTVQIDDTYDIPATLRDIAAKIEDGFTFGYYPTWELS